MAKDDHNEPSPTPRKREVVKSGGIAPSEADAEDVTRDTYGFSSPARPARSKEKRVSDADRAAAQAGIPGVDVPEPPGEAEADRNDEKP